MSTDNKQQRVELRAYTLWEQEGRPHGRHDHHWSEAERQLQDEDLQPVVEADRTPPQQDVIARQEETTTAAAQKPSEPAPAALRPAEQKPADARASRPGAIRSTYR